MDVRELSAGRFDAALKASLESAENFIVLLTPGCLDRCAEEHDWLRQEISAALLAKRNVPYEEINLAKDPEGRAELVRVTGMMTFPQVVIDGESIGGYQELVAADRSGRLADFSEAAA